MTHTPGPWTLDWYDHAADVMGKCSGYVVGKDSRPIVPIHKNYVADARLIAAAPQLLEALEALLAYENDSEPGFLQGDLDKARATIALAKGEVK